MALEIDRHELGERQLGSRDGLAAQLRLDDVLVVRERGGLGRKRALAAACAVGVVVAETPTVAGRAGTPGHVNGNPTDNQNHQPDRDLPRLPPQGDVSRFGQPQDGEPSGLSLLRRDRLGSDRGAVMGRAM